LSTIKANDLQNASGGIPTVKGQQLIPTAWVNFNGEGTVAIRDSENVSSITDDGTGEYIINFSNAMDNTNYVAVPTITNNRCSGTIDYNTTNITLKTRLLSNGSLDDTVDAGLIILGGQA
jgi:hypothetical protein